jgi:hypothetical protein
MFYNLSNKKQVLVSFILKGIPVKLLFGYSIQF